MTRYLLLALLSVQLGAFETALSGEVRCRVCGILIEGQAKYYQANVGQEVFCERCFNEAPRCSVCKLPTAAADIDRDTGACPRCLAKLPRCKLCGKPIVGMAYTSPYSSGFYCPECKRSRPSCYVCGLPVGKDQWRYPDGRIVCGECGARAVIDIGQIKWIMQDARETVEARLGLNVTRPYEVTVEKLQGPSPAVAGSGQPSLSGQSPLYGRELGMYRRMGEKSEIFLLFGLPPELLYEAAAHEYAHAWQSENCPANLTPELREGFAQWVAAEVLRDKRFNVALEKLEARRDDPYGTGYQRLKVMRRSSIFDLIMRAR